MLLRHQARIFPFLDIALNAFNYLYHIYVSWYLVPGNYGILNALLGLSVILMVSGIAFQNFMARNRSASGDVPVRGRIFFSGLAIWGGIPPVLLLGGSFWIAEFTRSSFKSVLLLSLLYIIHLTLSALRGIIQGKRHFLALNVSFYIEVGVKLTLLYFLLPIYRSVEIALAVIVIGMAASLIHAFFFLRSQGEFQPSESSELSRTIRLTVIMQGVSILYAANLVLYLFTSLDILLVNYRFPKDAGMFAVLQKYGQISFFAGSSLMTVMLPSLGASLPSMKNFSGVLRRFALILLSGLVAMILAYRFVLPWTVKPIFGEAYAAAADYLVLSGLTYAFLVIALFFSTSLIALNKKVYVPILALGALLLIPGLLIVPAPVINVFKMQIGIYLTLALVLGIVVIKEVRL